MKDSLKPVLNFDRKISEQLHDFEYRFLHSFFLSYTTLGSMHFTALLFVVLFQTGYTSILRELIIVLAISLVTTELLKSLFKRKRPDTRDKDVYILQNLSFPSGHSANAFATATVLTGISGLGNLPLVVASLVAFSRVYLGQHFLSDVIAGSLIGIIIATLI